MSQAYTVREVVEGNPIMAICQREFDAFKQQISGILIVEICHRSILLEIERRGKIPDSEECKILEARMEELRLVGKIIESRLGKPMFPDGSGGTEIDTSPSSP